MSKSQIDLGELRDSIGDILKTTLADIVDGAEEDLKTFGKDIAKDIVAAAKLGRRDLLDELQDQLVVIAEINRIRIHNEPMAAAKKALQVAAEFALKAVAAAI